MAYFVNFETFIILLREAKTVILYCNTTTRHIHIDRHIQLNFVFESSELSAKTKQNVLTHFSNKDTVSWIFIIQLKHKLNERNV